MATTQASICNVALAHIGEQSIAGITDDNPRANALHVMYEPTLREVLAAAPWKFATKRVDIAPSLVPPGFGWRYAFNLPSDFIDLVQFNNEEVWKSVSEFYDVENGQLITDADNARIKYVYFQEDTSRYHPLFAAALSRLLAARIASTVRKDGAQLARVMEESYLTVELPRARMANARLSRRYPYNYATESNWLAARRVSTRG
jgi:hypothetical protein